MFDPPKQFPNCLYCVEMRKNGQTPPPLLHLSAHVTGCPLFIELNLLNRDKVATALKLCKSCLRVNGPGHNKSCIVMKLKNKKNRTDKSKYEFTCRDQFFYRHMWLCMKHNSTNHDSMDKKSTDLQQKHGLKLVHFLGCNRPAPYPSVPVNDCSVLPTVPPDPVVPAPPGLTKSSSFKTAAKKLKKKSVGFNTEVEVVPIPLGEPMFMFQALKGKTGPVNAFYDSGCSNACLQTGIPGVQLHEQKIASGTFNVTGVNGVNIKAHDEWLVHLDRADGRKQLLRAVTLDRITGESPIFNVE